jgi:hypothetical protein
MDLYNSYVANTEIDLCNARFIERSTHIYRAWTDSLGDVHLDVQIDCTGKDEERYQLIIPDLCVPMDGIIHLKTINKPKDCTLISTQACYEPCRDISLQQGHSESPLTPSAKVQSPYYVYVAVQRPDSSAKVMTLEETERKLGYEVQIVSEKPIENKE